MRVAVIGAGYVGLPLAAAIAHAPSVHGRVHTVHVYDRDQQKCDAINDDRSYIDGVPDKALMLLDASTDPALLGGAEAIIICVPTPLNKTRDPDNSYVLSALDDVIANLTPPCLVVLESTTFPGFTREVVVPKFEAAGLKIDKDVFVAFSPERVDPGNKRFNIENTPKVLGAVSPTSMERALALYHSFVDHIVPVSSTDAAEMAKLLENTFRAVNIGLVNEMAIMCARLGLDTNEVIRAAATKPFGFMPFYPGPGLGGHCIPVDPLYLSWKMKTLKYKARFITLADEVNSEMPEFVVEMVAEALNARRKAMNGSRILVVGVAYKRDVADVRESPALDIIELLHARGATVAYSDPHVSNVHVPGLHLQHVPVEEAASFDCVVIATDHSSVDYKALIERAQLVVDTRGATRGCSAEWAGRIVSL